MRVTSLQVQDFKAYVDSGRVELGTTTILVGRNNAGKSSLIRGLLWMQQFQYVPPVRDDVRVGAGAALATVEFCDTDGRAGWPIPAGGSATLQMSVQRDSTEPMLRLRDPSGAFHAVGQFSGVEPNHFIVPFLARRKATAYQEDVSRDRALQVGPDLQYLAAKLTRVVDSEFGGNRRYADACRELVGTVIRPVGSNHGQLPGMYVDQSQSDAIFIDAMGDGVPHIVGLLADLVLSRGKLFVIEEPETDLHPHALKVLLDLMAEAAKTNQLVISTHSNIVVRHLGSLDDSVVHYVESERGARPPVASIRKVGPEPLDRIEVLRDLGYELYDFDLWDAWLILEESSAERIIRENLIPWFAPGLDRRVRTLSTGGNANVEATFEDFNRLVRFTHLEPMYRNRAWVLIDGDDDGQRIMHRLRQNYRTLDEDRFSVLSAASFEVYYPSRFAEQRDAALALPSRRDKRRAKRELLDDVLAWIAAEPEVARQEFERSAAEVIAALRRIEESLVAMTAEAAS